MKFVVVCCHRESGLGRSQPNCLVFKGLLCDQQSRSSTRLMITGSPPDSPTLLGSTETQMWSCCVSWSSSPSELIKSSSSNSEKVSIVWVGVLRRSVRRTSTVLSLPACSSPCYFLRVECLFLGLPIGHFWTAPPAQCLVSNLKILTYSFRTCTTFFETYAVRDLIPPAQLIGFQGISRR